MELIIAVVIVAILASIAIPLYFKAIETARGRSAVIQLNLIQAAEKIELLEEGICRACVGFAQCNTRLDIDLPDDGWVYRVVLTAAGANFNATATRAIPGVGNCMYTTNISRQNPLGNANCIF